MDIVFSPIITVGMIAQLKLLVKEHHYLFKLEFGQKLLPKHHFMVHYAAIIKKMGPIVFLWSMRFEAKHNYFKMLCHSYHNFKNICKT